MNGCISANKAKYDESQTDNPSHRRNWDFQLNQFHCTATVMNSALYVAHYDFFICGGSEKQKLRMFVQALPFVIT